MSSSTLRLLDQHSFFPRALGTSAPGRGDTPPAALPRVVFVADRVTIERYQSRRASPTNDGGLPNHLGGTSKNFGTDDSKKGNKSVLRLTALARPFQLENLRDSKNLSSQSFVLKGRLTGLLPT